MNFQVTGHDVTGCWYGKRSADDRVVHANELYAILSGLATWVGSVRHISETRMPDSTSTAPFTVYVKDCASKGNDFVFALWLSSNKDGDQNVYALNVDQAPNTTHEVKRNTFNPGEIPGLPAYIFVDSAACKLYTLRPPNIINTGRRQFDAAVQYYMEEHHATMEKKINVESDGTRIVSINMVSEKGESLAPKFCSTIERQKTKTDEILSRYSEIRKIVRVRKLRNIPIAEKKGLFSKLFDFLDTTIDDADISDSNRVKVEFDVRLSRQDVNRIIKHQENNSSSEEIGFKFKNDDKLVWANECIVRKCVEIPIDGVDEIVSSKSLLSGIERVREMVI